MILLNQKWHSTGSSGPVASAIFLQSPVRDIALFINHSTLASTQSCSLQSAIESTGPWFVEGSTQIAAANASTGFKLAAQGPTGNWIRVYLHSNSTGDYDFQLVGFD
jgi:Zn-dependent M28 family amino/carboxypeptidase